MFSRVPTTSYPRGGMGEHWGRRRFSQGRKRTHLRTIVTKGNFLPPTSSQFLSLLSASSHSWTFIPVIFFLPAEVVNRLAKVLNASKVFVSFTFEDEKGRDQSHDVKRASGVHVAPKEGEMVARIRARSRTDISFDRREFGHA